MNTEISTLIPELQTISGDAQRIFGSFSGKQINWKSGADAWSIGQCFEHLIKTNELFYEELDKISDGSRENSFLENYSPLSSFFGNLLINTLKKDARKIKAPTEKIVPSSEVEPNIIENFAAHQNVLIEKIKRTETADWRKIKITSGLMKIVTYSLADNFRIVVEHERAIYGKRRE